MQFWMFQKEKKKKRSIVKKNKNKKKFRNPIKKTKHGKTFSSEFKIHKKKYHRAGYKLSFHTLRMDKQYRNTHSRIRL